MTPQDPPDDEIQPVEPELDQGDFDQDGNLITPPEPPPEWMSNSPRQGEEPVEVTGDFLGDPAPPTVDSPFNFLNFLGAGGLALIVIVLAASAFLITQGAGPHTSAGRSTASSKRPTYQCAGDQVTLFKNWNVSGIQNGGAPPTFSTNGKSFCLTHIETYHWNDGKGAPPGTLGLTGGSSQGEGVASAGPFNALTSAGQDNATNVNWYVDPPRTPPTIINGTYACADSGSASWSSNKESGGQGFCAVYAIPAVLVQAVPAAVGAGSQPTSSSGGSGEFPIIPVVLGFGMVVGVGAVARWYAPRLGLFVTPDSSGLDSDPGHYGLEHGDPVNRTDPVGLDSPAPAAQSTASTPATFEEAPSDEIGRQRRVHRGLLTPTAGSRPEPQPERGLVDRLLSWIRGG